MADYGVISADSHFVEPPSMWKERLDAKFRDKAPHVEKDLNGKPGEYFVCENISPFPVAAFFGAGVPSAELAEHNKKGMDQAPACVWDPAARIKDQDRDGVVAEAIYTSMGMPLYMLDDVELRAACFRAYNDWAAEYCSHDPKRLLPLGLITLEDIEAGTRELERCAKKGIRGAMIWAEPPGDNPYSDTAYDSFWAAASDLNMPLSLHILTGRKGTGIDFFSNNLALQATTLYHEVERSLAVFVLGGVLERFPKLKIVSAENDVAWMSYFMWRMDLIHGRLGSIGTTAKLSLKPSEYVKRQVYATFINEPLFIRTLDLYGPDNAMWSSDYPHTAATWPHSQDFINKTFSELSETDRRKIVHDTAAKLYNIEV